MGLSTPTNQHRRTVLSKMTATTIRISSSPNDAAAAAAAAASLPTPPNSASNKSFSHASTISRDDEKSVDTARQKAKSNNAKGKPNIPRSISISGNGSNKRKSIEGSTKGIAGSRSMSTNNLFERHEKWPTSAQTDQSSDSRSSSRSSHTSCPGYATRRSTMVSPAPTSPLPDFSHVKSKIGSLDNIKHKPNSSTRKIFNENISSLRQRMSAHVSSKVGSKENIKHKPGGGHVTIYDDKAAFIKSKEIKSKIGSLENLKHKPKGGDVKIYEDKTVYTKFSRELARSKVGSFENIKHKPAGGDVKIYEDKALILKLKEVKPKVGSLDNVKHTPRGGDLLIYNEKLTFKESAKSRVDAGSRQRRSKVISQQQQRDNDDNNKSSPISAEEGAAATPPTSEDRAITPSSVSTAENPSAEKSVEVELSPTIGSAIDSKGITVEALGLTSPESMI